MINILRCYWKYYNCNMNIYRIFYIAIISFVFNDGIYLNIYKNAIKENICILIFFYSNIKYIKYCVYKKCVFVCKYLLYVLLLKYIKNEKKKEKKMQKKNTNIRALIVKHQTLNKRIINKNAYRKLRTNSRFAF